MDQQPPHQPLGVAKIVLPPPRRPVGLGLRQVQLQVRFQLHSHRLPGLRRGFHHRFHDPPMLQPGAQAAQFAGRGPESPALALQLRLGPRPPPPELSCERQFPLLSGTLFPPGVEAENARRETTTHRYMLPRFPPGPAQPKRWRTLNGSNPRSGSNSLADAEAPERFRPQPFHALRYPTAAQTRAICGLRHVFAGHKP